MLEVSDLGVGNGIELNIILNYLLANNKEISTFKCSLIDFSYHMLRVAVNSLEEYNFENEKYIKNVRVLAINSDFRDLHLCSSLLTSNTGCRFFTFLGGTLGNFLEREVLTPIRKEMTDKDLFLLGVDLIGERSKEELVSSYDSIYNRKFLFNPLQDLGITIEDCNFRCYIDDKISEIRNSKTIVSSFTQDREIQMAFSTKYELESFKIYLKENYGFQTIKKIINDFGDYAILLLKK